MLIAGITAAVVVSTLAVLANTSTPVILGSTATAVAAVIAASLAYVGNRRGSRDSREITLIHEAQDVLHAENARLRGDLTEARRELTEARSELSGLRTQVAAMRLELAESLAHHSECEQMRGALERVIADLQEQLRGRR